MIHCNVEEYLVTTSDEKMKGSNNSTVKQPKDKMKSLEGQRRVDDIALSRKRFVVLKKVIMMMTTPYLERERLKGLCQKLLRR